MLHITRISIEAWIWRRAASHRTQYAHMSEPPFLEAMRSVVRDKALTPRERATASCWYAGKYCFGCECRCGEMFERPEDMWSHYAWSCPITHMYRMQYGFTDAQLLYAARNMRNPYLASAVFPDPRRMLPPPAVSMSFGWYIAPWAGSSEALFSGSCFGDGSVAHGSSINASRAGWSVVMLSCHYLPALVEKAAWGGLPHAVQDIQGAELYAVLHWLTHLDPAGVFHTFYTDSAWVYDGWHQMDQMCLPSSAYCDLWVRVRTAAEEMPSATLQKTKAHLSETAVLGNPQREYERIGNKFADEYAREKGRADVMGDAAFACRVDRMRSVSFLVAKYYSRLWFGRASGICYQVSQILSVDFVCSDAPYIGWQQTPGDRVGVSCVLSCLVSWRPNRRRSARGRPTAGHTGSCNLERACFVPSVGGIVLPVP